MEAKGNPYMEAAKDVMDKINQSETERYLYLRQEMAITDEKSRLMTAERKGREEGEILKLISLVQKKCLRGKALEVVSEELEEDPENIREIYGIDAKLVMSDGGYPICMEFDRVIKTL